MTHILNAEPLNYSDEARRILQSLGELHERAVTRRELMACLPDFDVLIVRLGFQVDREVIDAGRCLKAIVTATTGLDHIDVDYANSRGIAVLSLREETEFLHSVPATAEHTWGLLLGLVRRIPWAFQAVQIGKWNRDQYRGHDLSRKRLGIAGLGRIGEKVAHYGLAFGMAVTAFDPYRSDWLPGVDRCNRFVDLLQQADVLSLHVPLNRDTQHMVGARELALLPPGAILINTSRGPVLDETALLAALMQGHLAGAALDVLADEGRWSDLREHPLVSYARSHDNLLLTPHTGGATVESMAATEVFMAKKLRELVIT